MKILIYGAGVIGCTYGWQLAKAGNDVSIFVRKGKKQTLEENGINIYCTDLRDRKKIIQDITFRPKVIDTLTVDNDFDYIIVTTNNLNLDNVLTDLKETAGKADILFFQNVWINDVEKIKTHLSPEQYFFGFPFMAGGGRDENGINSIISGSKYSYTMLGEATGEITPRVKRIANILSDANMKPFISNQIITWLIPHYAFIVGISAGIITKGNMSNFLKDSKTVKNSILAIRDGFHVCEAMGIDPKKEKVNKLYYLPLFISSFIVKKVFSDAAMQAMIDGYLKNSSYEIKGMIENIIQSAKTYNIEIPYLITFKNEIKHY
ncbi:ketopantoate reductase family protein [Dysgonomonas sp. Marseille-P4677]|uniref:ketopantoate reductase family protein n=1 Tax=Dysgonomonas sp. Marseille-P4677 TaxID=2364790 RepID=UPI00191477F9|nr:ketopantoate reductase family protein [Dysgonomonas sp. Marseille-P4677]MBK5721445.1 ketopantoate reductase family protein [Dysgonomonas sp. Marseille-P4677]